MVKKGTFLMFLLLTFSGCVSDSEPVVEDLVIEPEPMPEPEPEPINETVEPVIPWFPNDGTSELVDLRIEAFDGLPIPVSLHKPVIANNETPFPVLIQSHGFTGSRTHVQDAFQDYIAAGFAVVSFDQRGHGDRRGDSDVKFMHPDFEVQDTIAIIDEIATWDWVLMEAPGDPVLGGIGYSYGGAMQTMASLYDDRIDALVPEITWHDITESLSPNDAPKSGWIDVFYAAGNAQRSVTFSEDFHRGWVYANAANEFPAGQAPGVPDLYGEMKKASPATYGGLTVPTLFVQGMPDTLFPLNEAVRNLQMMNPNVPSALYTHNAGHVLNTASLAPGSSPQDAGLQGVPGERPCGDQTSLNIAWHQTHLLGLDAWTGPRVCIALEDETFVAGTDFPLPGTEMIAYDIGDVAVPQSGVVSQSITLFTAEEETVIAGIPELTGTMDVVGADGIVYFSLHVPSREGMETYVDDQVTPLRFATGATEFDIELHGVGTRLAAGESLELRVTNWEPMYFANSERLPGAVLLEGLTLELPHV